MAKADLIERLNKDPVCARFYQKRIVVQRTTGGLASPADPKTVTLANSITKEIVIYPAYDYLGEIAQI